MSTKRNDERSGANAAPQDASRDAGAPPPYAELHCLSNFSFLRGASSARELFERAAALGYGALAITDDCTLAGIVRAYEAAKATGLALIVGAEFTLDDGTRFVLLVEDQEGYTALCGLITQGRRAASKGAYRLGRQDVEAMPRAGLLAIALGAATRTPTEGTVGARFSARSLSEESESAGRKDRALKRAPTKGPRTTGKTGTKGARASCVDTADALAWLHALFPRRCWLALELHRGARDARRLADLQALSAASGVPLVACGDVHMHVRARRALQDVMVAIRLRTPVAEAGLALFPNGERHLRRREALARLYPGDALAESVRIAQRCRFDLGKLRYEYPHELVPAHLGAAQHLRELTLDGAALRWPQGTPAPVAEQIEHELRLIAELKYEHFFLTVHDVVRYARQQGILCQGRGSAANSAVCYCLGITEVDPARMNMLFERFLSKERNEPPDIDVDFEHERREEVIQYVYRKYGRERAALAATVICYRGKSTVRDVGKALGLDLDQVEQLSASLQWWNGLDEIGGRLLERGFDPEAPVMRRLLKLSGQLVGFPRHLSQHVGGFVISEHPLSTLVPVENASMPERTVIQWDKDDLDALGLLKVDCLALGMLTCIRRCFDLVHGYRDGKGTGNKGVRAPFPNVSLSPERHGKGALTPLFPLSGKWTLATIPAEDPETYAMIQRADTVGVFQIESRAQMSMLPRLKPKNFYDLVIEVAIVRPGPIQGKMVHPYLRRRQGLEPVDYPSEDLKRVFERTLGVPIFQEQVMQLAIVAAGFTPGEADALRRSMAAWKRHGGLEHFQNRIMEGMTARGYAPEFAAQVFEQIKGFGSYGFPESHSASFALLVYASCWLKCHEPAAYACALLNSQPMGFYSAGQILQDARQHGIVVRPPCVIVSGWDSGLEAKGDQSPFSDRAAAAHAVQKRGSDPLLPPTPTEARAAPAQPALRLGLREIRGIDEACAQRIVSARETAPFRDLEDLVARAGLDRFAVRRLAEAGALRQLTGHRRRAYWNVAALEQPAPLLADTRIPDERVTIAPAPAGEEIRTDYATLGYTLGRHPLALLRGRLQARGARGVRETQALAHGTPTRAAGLVTLRQRPSTASGVTFLTLEDETGWLNIVVWRTLAERQRRVLLESQLLAIDGTLETSEGVTHLIARRLHDWSALLDGLDARSRDFH